MRPISLEEKHENFVAVVRNWKTLAVIELKMTCSDNESEQEHVRHFLYKTRKFLDVSRRSPLNNGKEMYEKSVLQVQRFFLLIRFTDFFTVFVAVAA